MPDAVSAPTPRPLLPGHPLLGRAFYLHGLFPEEFLDELLAWRSRVACDRASGNMLARRYHFTSEEVATTLLDGLRRSGVADVCGYSRVIPVVRVIDYPSGGYIAPHTDGVDYHPTTGEASTTSFLLYLSTSVDTGETNFLVTGSEEDTRDQTDGEDGASSILYSVQPQRGSLLVFPHDAYHEGVGVGAEGKILLRGNLL